MGVLCSRPFRSGGSFSLIYRMSVEYTILRSKFALGITFRQSAHQKEFVMLSMRGCLDIPSTRPN